MQNVKNLTAQAQFALQNRQSQNQMQAAPVVQPAKPVDNRTESEKQIDRIFIELKRCCPAWRVSLKDQKEYDGVKNKWLAELIRNKINTDQQIDAGLKKAALNDSSFFPSIGQFIKWCIPGPEDFGLPMTHTAYHEACQNAQRPGQTKWTHNAVYVAGKTTGWYELRSRAEREVYPLFKRNYEEACRKVMAGEELVIHKALPGRRKTVAEKHEEHQAKEQAKKIKAAGLGGLTKQDAISRMRAMVGGAA